jgi:hypothetical protein
MAEMYGKDTPKKDVEIEQVKTEVTTDVVRIPCTDGITGGFALTGFIDIEDIIKIKKCPWNEKTLFLEKKLPFSVVVIGLETGKDKKDD